MRVCTSMAAMLLLTCAGAASAQTRIDRSFNAVSKDCSGIQWSKEALERYPTIGSACRGVEERDGKTYVKFEGTVKQNIDRGKQLVVEFTDGGEFTVTPPAEMALYINDRKTPVSQLSRGDELNFYMPEDRFTAQFAQDATPTPQYVSVPITYRETESTYQAAALPATASNDALMVMFGSVLAAFGMLLTIRRRNFGR
jgi:LPXTG-motif cell wall-anchored protein